MARDDHWRGLHALRIHRVRVIADVHDGGVPLQPLFQLAREKNKFIHIRQPLRDERPCCVEISEHGLRLNEGNFHARFAQTGLHHRGEAQHTLLTFERIITDQQNHCGGPGRRRFHAAGWRAVNGEQHRAHARRA